jgi:hypothetical protein
VLFVGFSGLPAWLCGFPCHQVSGRDPDSPSPLLVVPYRTRCVRAFTVF